MKIRPIYRAFPELNIPDLVKAELPFVQELYNHEQVLHKDVRDLLEFYLNNANDLPMYAMSKSSADKIQETMTAYAGMLQDALGKMFALSDAEIRTWYACSNVAMPGFDNFLAYARHMYSRRGNGFLRKADTIYGRVDGAVDPVSGELMGVYEFNGDTPVMLFESVNLQNLLSTMLGDPAAQANDWWPQTQASLSQYKDKAIAIACDVNWIEDSVTSETIAQAFESVGARAYFTTLAALNHDVLALEKPFFVEGVSEHMDAVFMLLPWEEMWTSGADIIAHWKRWCDNVTFFEPPWRWFMSHKAMLAWVTHLMETDTLFRSRYGKLPHLRTYMCPDKFIAEGKDYVSKPVIGRLSQNITIVRNGEATEPTEGMYGKEPMVYQEYLAPGRVEGRNNFIIGGWMAGDSVATLCFREFDGAVLDLMNERFIAHQLVK